MSDQSHHESILDKLPLEIVVHSLCYTNASIVWRFSSCSSACKALVDDNSQIIYQALALRHFNALTLCTAGDSGITRDALPDFVVREDEDAQNEGDIAPVDAELQRAIRCQRNSSGAYDSVKTWKDFMKKRTLIDYNWKHGRPARYAVAKSLHFNNISCGIWRFKVCSYSKKVIASTPAVPMMNMGLVFTSPRHPFQGEPHIYRETQGWTHVEYSNGYLIYIDRRDIEVHAYDPQSDGFKRKHSLAPPTPLISYKARYPYLLSLSRVEAKAYVFDIGQGHLPREYELPDGPEPAYVELDQWSLFIAGSNLSIINRNNGFVHQLLDVSIEEGSEQALWSTRWCAVHHSLDGRHLIVVGDANEVVWIRNYRDVLSDTNNEIDRQKLTSNTVVLRLEESPGEITIDNVCVENDRVVFTTQTVFFPVVYLFELNDWTDFSDFRAHAPRLRILSGGFPVGHDGISRVEMDSTCVYLTASTKDVYRQTPGFEDIHPSDLEIAWYKLDGTRLCEANVRPTWPPSSPAQKHDMRDFGTRPRVLLNDAIICYDFSIPHDLSPFEEC